MGGWTRSARRSGSPRPWGAARRADACETLLLRARADLDGERPREAALQLRVGLEALLAEVSPSSAPAGKGGAAQIGAEQAARQVADLAELEGRRSATGEAANEALTGELTAERTAEVADTLAPLRARAGAPADPAQ